MKIRPTKLNIHAKNICLLLMLLMAPSFARATDPGEAKKSMGVFVNDRRLHIGMDSVSIGEKGILTLHGLINESVNGERLRFRIFVRHRNFAGKILLFPWDEPYQDGEGMNAVDLRKILLKTQVGDQLTVIPFDSKSNYVNSREQFQITVKGEGC